MNMRPAGEMSAMDFCKSMAVFVGMCIVFFFVWIM